ncbi:MAG: acyl transferase [Crocinitomicaceae bacterium]|nr:acyl transferase [Crocinitomicaceae bacterium]|tara:strand:- start:189 stop:1154 length:966 start_codon:yes stop_codon:yes gene_type:complete
MELIDQIFDIQSNEDFEKVALEVYSFQKDNCTVYSEYLNALNKPEPANVSEIPFLPISFFKSHKVISGDSQEQVLFKSSGTSSERSQHFVLDTELYKKSFIAIYKDQIGDPKDQVILALLPNYLEQGESSLVYMVDELIRQSESQLSGFFLENYSDLITNYNQAIASGKSVVIFGVSYALLDLAELKPNLSKATIIETGGMKGRRKELSKKELHAALKKGFDCASISSEYGMTELLSQSYSNSDGKFDQPAWMKIMIRDINDPFSFVREGKSGGINIIDLANLNSCSFIATQDLGKMTNNQFEILGRFDNSDIRGCNLLIE